MASEPNESEDGEPLVEARLVEVPSASPPAPRPSATVAPQWLHPSSVLFEVLSSIRQFLFAAIVALFLASAGNRYALIAAGGAVIFTAARSLLHFLTLRYQLAEGELRIDEGLIFRRHRTVPVARIQNIDLLQNPLHHALGVAEVRVETAGGSEPEAKLRVLSLSDVARLRAAIFQHPAALQGSAAANAAATNAAATGLPPNLSPAAAGPSPGASFSAAGPSESAHPDLRLAGGPPHWSYRISARRLVWAGLLSNRGLVLIPIVLGAVSQLDFEQRMNFRHVPDVWPRDLSTAATVAAGVVAAIAILGLLRIASAGWFLFRFYGYALERHGEDLRISCGLFTRVSATVPRHRIQFLSIQQTLLGRIFGLGTIRIETAGGGAKQNEDAAETVARRWFVPVLKIADAAPILAELRPGLGFQPESVPWQPTSPRTARRLIRVAGFVAVLIAAGGLLVSWPWGSLAGVASLPLLVYLAIRYAHSLKFARSEDWVAFRSGILYRKTSLTFFDKVQTVAVAQSPFDRRWGMATLRVDTAAAGPAQHRIEVKYLPTAVATGESVQIAAQASQNPDPLHVRSVADHLASSRSLPGDARRSTGATAELVDQ